MLTRTRLPAALPAMLPILLPTLLPTLLAALLPQALPTRLSATLPLPVTLFATLPIKLLRSLILLEPPLVTGLYAAPPPGPALRRRSDPIVASSASQRPPPQRPPKKRRSRECELWALRATRDQPLRRRRHDLTPRYSAPQSAAAASESVMLSSRARAAWSAVSECLAAVK